MKNLEYEYISVREMGWDAYENINPHRLVPALLVSDELIPQSNAILHYLEEQFPEPPLLPADPILRAQSRAFAQYIVCEMHAVDIVRIRKFLDEDLNVDSEGLEQWSNHWFTNGFSKLEQTLANRPELKSFPCCYGEKPGWAELHLVPHLRKGISRFNLDITQYPLLANIYKYCVTQQDFIKAAPQSQPDYPGEIIDPSTEK